MTLSTTQHDQLTTLFFRDACDHMFTDPDRTRVETTDGYVLGTAKTPSPDLNLLYVHPGAHDVPTLVGTVVERLQAWHLPFLCGVAPDAAGAQAGEALQGHGLTPLMTLPIMTLHLQALRESDAQVQGLSVTRVRTDGDWQAWCEVASDAFDFSPEMSAATEAALRRPAVDAASRGWFYVDWLDEKPVGSALMVLGEDEVGMWCIGTAKSARRQGVGAAMTTGPLLEARAVGHTRARLGATPAGFPVYTRLGWQVEQHVPFYLYAPDGTPAHV